MNVDSLNVSDNVKQLLKAMDAEGATLDGAEFLTVCCQLDMTRDVVTICQLRWKFLASLFSGFVTCRQDANIR